jgi:hypothetical protein
VVFNPVACQPTETKVQKKVNKLGHLWSKTYIFMYQTIYSTLAKLAKLGILAILVKLAKIALNSPSLQVPNFALLIKLTLKYLIFFKIFT